MDSVYDIIMEYGKPLFSPFLFLALPWVFLLLSGKSGKGSFLFKGLCLLMILMFWILYMVVHTDSNLEPLFFAIESPFYFMFTVIVFPPLFLYRTKYRLLALPLPFLFLIFFMFETFYVPRDPGVFTWVLSRPIFTICGVASLLVLLSYIVNPERLRVICRVTAFLILIYGGFAFRQDYSSYVEMQERRGFFEPPVMSGQYLPSAPCRFSADGAYVQGCVMELAQRIMQTGFNGFGLFHLLLIAFLALSGIFVMYIAGGRWFCGWVCPLASIGDSFDFTRRFLCIPFSRNSQLTRTVLRYCGYAAAGFGLLMAGKNGKAVIENNFMGCKVPFYPFCMICPGREFCALASGGLPALQPLPSWDFLFGFFRIAAILLLIFFMASFFMMRRLWCSFCPMGTAGGFFNRIAFLRLKKNPLKCNGCGVCADVCPMDIERVRDEIKKTDISSGECLLCMKCVNKCPQNGCLSAEFARKKILESHFP